MGSTHSPVLRIAGSDRGLPSRKMGRIGIPARPCPEKRFLLRDASSRWQMSLTRSVLRRPYKEAFRLTSASRSWPMAEENTLIPLFSTHFFVAKRKRFGFARNMLTQAMSDRWGLDDLPSRFRPHTATY